MPPLRIDAPKVGKAYWRSLDELADRPEFRKFVQDEFPAWADEMLAPGSRRGFLKLMGASMALAGATACRWPTEEILPFADRPSGYAPGEPLHYATSIEQAGVATGLLVKSYDGRPIKVEGNPSHPQSRGATSAIQQASLLELYDPDRSRGALRREGDTREPVDSADWERALAARVGGRQDGGSGLRLLSEATSSRTVRRLRDELLTRFPRARWYEYEPISRDNERDGTRMVFGKEHRVQPSFDRAEVVVSLDDDFLFAHPNAVGNAGNWVQTRDPDSGFESRLYMIESGFSTTGSMADNRIALPSRLIPVAAACIAAELFLEQGLIPPDSDPGLGRLLERFQFHPLYTEIDWSFARDLATRRGRSLVVAGPRQPAEVHALVALINEALGNLGSTVDYTEALDPGRDSHVQAIARLTGEMESGQVDTLVVFGGNPVYDAPADLAFGATLEGVESSFHLSVYDNETSEACSWHLPRAHFLESWCDAEGYAGEPGVGQPLIEPLYEGRTAAEVLAVALGRPASARDLVRSSFADLDEPAWRRMLHDGLIAGSVPKTSPRCRAASWSDGLKDYLRTRSEMPDGRLELVFHPGAATYDGRYANNGWLQELPDAMSKLTWDNALLIAPSTAEGLGVEQGDLLRIEQGGRSVELPVHLMPGQAAGSAAVQLGYGRRRCGRVGDGIGSDLYPLRTVAAMNWVEVIATATGRNYPLAATQDHFAIDALGARERADRIAVLVREIELEEYRQDPAAALHHGHDAKEVRLWDAPVEYDGYKWGMAIDMNACTGCNACVVACQSENNIPVVGKDEVARGREMHWIRIDRYFAGPVEAPQVTHQPLTCQHCEDAPCEQVCPVAATIHDQDGLNTMVYNRCVGTRYCANNCPYKVRRFNYFNNHKHDTPTEAMIFNPEVTVRARGVMEKCTFCVQRIRGAKIAAKSEGRTVQDGEVTTACQQACPTRAISFGNLNDPQSDVHAKYHDPRAYAMLEEWNVKPRNRFLARVRNPGRRKRPGATG